MPDHGQRLGEVSGMTREELHLDRAEWHLPGSRTKNKAPHIVPLSDMALASSGTPWRRRTGRRLFPMRRVTVSSMVSHSEQARPVRHCAMVGARPCRTALTGMARLGVAPIVLGHVANHRTTTRAGVTLAVY